jgi:hypothetical protein
LRFTRGRGKPPKVGGKVQRGKVEVRISLDLLQPLPYLQRLGGTQIFNKYPVQGQFQVKFFYYIYSLWGEATGISQEFRMYISRDEVLCIKASEFLIFYEFHVPWSAWSQGSTLDAWYRGNFRKYSFSHLGAGI